MSAIDRAFIRAYSKDVAAEPVVEETAPATPVAASPYVLFQTPRRPETTYRIEPAAPWGQSAVPAPHIEMPRARKFSYEPVAAPSEPAAYHAPESIAPPPPKVTVPQFVAAEPPVVEQKIVEAKPQFKPEPEVIAKVTVAKIVDPIELYSRDEFICLPGMSLPQHGYVAVAEEEFTTETVAAVIAPAIVEVAPPVAKAPKIEAAAKVEAPEPIAPVIEVKVEAKEVAAIIEPIVEAVAPPAEDAPVFWEVDRFLVPAIAERLLRELPYFAQAGEKLRQASAAGLKVLAITGLGRGEGRSTLAICMALCAAKAGLNVGLMDLDFSQPDLATKLGLELPPSNGWQNVAVGKLAIAEVAVRSIEDHLTLLPLTADTNTGKLSLHDPRVELTISETARLFDVLILDAGPLDANKLRDKPPFDASIVICDLRHHSVEAAQSLARSLSNAGVEAVGIAENFAAP